MSAGYEQEERRRKSTYPVSGHVDCFKNHDELLSSKSQSPVDVGVVVHEGGGKR